VFPAQPAAEHGGRRAIPGTTAADRRARACRIENLAASRVFDQGREDAMKRRPLSVAAALLLLSPVLADDFFVDGRNGADLPGNGRSWQTPWKTIAYALAQIPAPAQGATHALHIAGGQTYAAATNGEVYPLAMRPAIALVGEGSLPVLEPELQSALRFARDKASKLRVGVGAASGPWRVRGRDRPEGSGSGAVSRRSCRSAAA
jgi:hypothetical protein